MLDAIKETLQGKKDQIRSAEERLKRAEATEERLREEVDQLAAQSDTEGEGTDL